MLHSIGGNFPPMRNLFIIGLKLLGILCLYWALGEVAQVSVAITTLPSMKAMGIQPVWYIFSVSLYVLVHLLFSLVLLFRSDGIAKALRVPDTAFTPGQITPAALLYTLLIAISVFILIQAIPQVLRHLFTWAELRDRDTAMSAYQIGELVVASAQIALAIIVVCRMRTMASKLLPPVKDALEKLK